MKHRWWHWFWETKETGADWGSAEGYFTVKITAKVCKKCGVFTVVDEEFLT